MKNLNVLLSGFMLTGVLVFSSCLKTPDDVPAPLLKIGLVSGVGGFSDRGFNQNILDGFQRAEKDFPIFCQTRESASAEEISTNINDFVSAGFDLIITAGFDAADATVKAAKANPGTDFLILDYTMTSPPFNLLCAVFDVDQGSFPCGFLAAYWAYKSHDSNPVAGFVAGPEIPEIRQFSVSYIHGVAYFNELYKKNVGTLGYYATSFSDTLQGAKLADSLIQQQTDVIFAFAGKTGNGALYKAREAGIQAIGVDVDQYLSIPQVGPVLLTSCMKGLDVLVYNVIGGYSNLIFTGGSVVHGNLGNGGVGLAPFHDYVAMIPDTIKTALDHIETGIKNGTIHTGWPE